MDENGGGGGFDFNQLANGVFALLGKKVEADAAVQARGTWGAQSALYGVDEYGRVYYRGTPSASMAPGSLTASPLVTVGVVVLAATLVFVALKN